MNRPQSLTENGIGAHPVGKRAAKRRDVENLITELEQSPSAENTGAIALDHIDAYDDDFFDALTELIASNQAHGRTSQVQTLEAIQDYLQYICRRARAGQTSEMWEELAIGAAAEGLQDAA